MTVKILIKKLLRAIKRSLDPYLRKYLDTYFWRFRHYIRSDWKSGYLDSNSLNHPHRELLIDLVRSKPKFKSLLELGTGSGINLIKLSVYFSSIKYIGIDINQKAISKGMEYLEKNNISNIQLIADDIFTIKKMDSRSVDYVLTDAVLMYIEPNILPELLNEMLRVSRSGFIMFEQASSGGEYEDHWRHDYEKVLATLGGIKSYSLSEIPEQYWSDDWIKYGRIIEVEKIAK